MSISSIDKKSFKKLAKTISKYQFYLIVNIIHSF